MRRKRTACHQLGTESAANNMARMREADEGIVQLVKDSMSKLTTTMNKELQVVAKGQPAPALGQHGVPIAQVIVPPLLLPRGTPIQCGPATADPNAAPVAQNALPAINAPQAQGQVIPGASPAQVQVVPSVVFGSTLTASARTSHFYRSSTWTSCSRCPFRVKLKVKRKDKAFVSFLRQEKLLQVLFWVNLSRKSKDKLFLSFWRKDKSLQVSRRVNLNH